MIRTSRLAAILVLALTGCASIPDMATGNSAQVELTVAGPPVEASGTADPFLYKKPSLPDGISQESGGGWLAQEWSMLGREDRSAQLDDSEYSARPCEALPNGPIGTMAVLDTIVEQAKNTRIVIINESHVNTLHRDFSRKLIERLREKGFSTLAAETFSNIDGGADPVEEYGSAPYVSSQIGWYSKEAIFGQMLREAKRLNYRFVAYEQIHDPNAERPEDVRISIRDREIAQASNLAAILDTMPAGEKLIVHVGYSHAREIITRDEDGMENAWMAARLKRLTGIDPLTISQTECRGGAEEMRLAAAPDGKEGWFDLIIDHPTSNFRFGRPEWRFINGNQAVEIPEELRATDTPLVIETFAQGDPFEAVPIDRIWFEPGEDIRLALPPGAYNVRAIIPSTDNTPAPAF